MFKCAAKRLNNINIKIFFFDILYIPLYKPLTYHDIKTLILFCLFTGYNFISISYYFYVVSSYLVYFEI
jgi:hypothetical protein